MFNGTYSRGVCAKMSYKEMTDESAKLMADEIDGILTKLLLVAPPSANLQIDENEFVSYIIEAVKIREFVETRIKLVFHLMEEFVEDGQVYGKGIKHERVIEYWQHAHEHKILQDMIEDSKK